MTADIVKLFSGLAKAGQGLSVDPAWNTLWVDPHLTVEERQAGIIQRQNAVINQCADMFAEAAKVHEQMMLRLKDAEKLARRAAGEKLEGAENG